MPELSVVVPCYNEAKNLPSLLARAAESLDHPDIDLILVDNGSTDETPQVLKKLLPSYPFARSIRVDINRGYGYGILQGLEAATGNILGWTHADMQTDLKDVWAGYQLYKEHPQEKIIVKGKRKKRALLDVCLTLGMQIVASLALQTTLDDINAQPKLFGRSFYNAFIKGAAPHDFSLDLFLLYIAQKKGYKIMTFPVIFAKRLHGEAKGGGASWKTRLKIIGRTFVYISELRHRMLKEAV